MKRQANLQHVQTLVEMNHCVETARRDAAFEVLEAYTSTGIAFETAEKRLVANRYCVLLVEEAIKATKNSSLIGEHQNVCDRPAIHFLNLLQELAHTMVALANHVTMVEQETAALSQAMGEKAHELLINTCQQFEETENSARNSFLTMLKVGKELLAMSTDNHRKRFTADDQRRYRIAHDEFTSYYRDEITVTEGLSLP